MWVIAMLEQAQKARLENNVERFREVLDKDEFFSRELEAPKEERQTIISILRSAGAIASKGRETPEGECKPINVWQWVNHQDHLQQYVKDRDELPCSCRAHIPPERTEGGEFVCKFCGQGHSRDTIKEAL